MWVPTNDVVALLLPRRLRYNSPLTIRLRHKYPIEILARFLLVFVLKLSDITFFWLEIVAYCLKPITLFSALLVAVLVQYFNYPRTIHPASTMSEIKSVAYFVNWVCCWILLTSFYSISDFMIRVYSTMPNWLGIYTEKKAPMLTYPTGNLRPQLQPAGSARGEAHTHPLCICQYSSWKRRSVCPALDPYRLQNISWPRTAGTWPTLGLMLRSITRQIRGMTSVTMRTDVSSSFSCSRSRTASWRSCFLSVAGLTRPISRSLRALRRVGLHLPNRRRVWFLIWDSMVCFID